MEAMPVRTRTPEKEAAGCRRQGQGERTAGKSAAVFFQSFRRPVIPEQREKPVLQDVAPGAAAGAAHETAPGKKQEFVPPMGMHGVINGHRLIMEKGLNAVHPARRAPMGAHLVIQAVGRRSMAEEEARRSMDARAQFPRQPAEDDVLRPDGGNPAAVRHNAPTSARLIR